MIVKLNPIFMKTEFMKLNKEGHTYFKVGISSYKNDIGKEMLFLTIGSAFRFLSINLQLMLQEKPILYTFSCFNLPFIKKYSESRLSIFYEYHIDIEDLDLEEEEYDDDDDYDIDYDIEHFQIEDKNLNNYIMKQINCLVKSKHFKKMLKSFNESQSHSIL